MSDNWLKTAVVGGLAACATGLAVYGVYKLNNRQQYDWKEVGKISQLMIHPVKACRGLQVESAQCTPLGMKTNDGTLQDR